MDENSNTTDIIPSDSNEDKNITPQPTRQQGKKLSTLQQVMLRETIMMRPYLLPSQFKTRPINASNFITKPKK